MHHTLDRRRGNQLHATTTELEEGTAGDIADVLGFADHCLENGWVPGDIADVLVYGFSIKSDGYAHQGMGSMPIGGHAYIADGVGYGLRCLGQGFVQVKVGTGHTRSR